MNNKINRALFRRYYKYIHSIYNKQSEYKSEISLDIAIPTIKKDLNVLPYCIDNLRKNLLHPISNIYIIAPYETEILDCCKKKQVVFIDEKKLEPLSKACLDITIRGVDHSGWIYQQLLKLNLDNLNSETRNILVIDSDTLLTREQCFLNKDHYIFNISDEFHFPYSKPLQDLLNIKNRFPASFVAHMMIFNVDILKELKNKIESITHKKWYNAIVDSIDLNSIAPFSEYELYGNYMNQHYPNKMKIEYWFNETGYRDELETKYFKVKLKSKSKSFHSYLKNDKNM